MTSKLEMELGPMHPGGEEKLGEVKAMVWYDYSSIDPKHVNGKLRVIIKEARNLKAMDMGGTSDP